MTTSPLSVSASWSRDRHTVKGNFSHVHQGPATLPTNYHQQIHPAKRMGTRLTSRINARCRSTPGVLPGGVLLGGALPGGGAGGALPGSSAGGALQVSSS